MSAARDESGYRRALRLLVTAALVVWIVVGALVVWLEHDLWGETGTVPDAFIGLTDRPPPPTSGARNFLVVLAPPEGGSCTSDDCWSGTGGTPLLLHLDPAVQQPIVIGLPHLSPDEQSTPADLVAAVESETGVRIEHLLLARWSGLAELVDHAGGVVVELASASEDPDTGIHWAAGLQHLDGDGAVAFVSQRSGLAGPDSQAIRELAVLRTTLGVALAQEMRKEPWLIYRFAHTAAGAVDLDEGWSVGELRALGWSLRNLRSFSITYAVAPDEANEAQALWAAVRDDTAPAWLAEHPEVQVPAVVA